MLWLIIAAFAAIQLGDVIFKTRIDPHWVKLRYWITLFTLIIMITGVLITRPAHLPSWVLGALALGPPIFMMGCIFARRKIYSFLLFGICFGLAFFSAILSIFGQSNLALLNGYPQPLLLLPLVWGASALLALFAPSRFLNSDLIPEAWSRRSLTHLTIGVLGAFAIWLAATQYIVFSARALNPDGNWCIQETDGTRLKHTLWLSPRKIFFENDYKGITKHYLTARSQSGAFDHHWSFRNLSFQTPNNWMAEGFGFYRTQQQHPPC